MRGKSEKVKDTDWSVREGLRPVQGPPELLLSPLIIDQRRIYTTQKQGQAQMFLQRRRLAQILFKTTILTNAILARQLR